MKPELHDEKPDINGIIDEIKTILPEIDQEASRSLIKKLAEIVAGQKSFTTTWIIVWEWYIILMIL